MSLEDIDRLLETGDGSDGDCIFDGVQDVPGTTRNERGEYVFHRNIFAARAVIFSLSKMHQRGWTLFASNGLVIGRAGR